MKRSTPMPRKRATPRRKGLPLRRVGKADANFRCPTILDLAAKAPVCMNPGCSTWNNAQVVACHSNHQRHGKGIGIKAHDIPVYLCGACHDKLDGRAKGWDQVQREQVWAEALFQTMLWLLSSGHIVVWP